MSRAGIRQRRRPLTDDDRRRIEYAVGMLRNARDHLRTAGAHHAADAARRALTSAEGARRHAGPAPTEPPEPPAFDCGDCLDGTVMSDTCDECGERHCQSCDPCSGDVSS